ncbi:MAG: hypothetical protein JXN60_08570 [Lentisphaerae bacterium]|nr:hypothetical protein [Lentisphaerota bacterium]
MGLARTGVLLAWGAVSFRARFVTEAVLSFVICVTDQVSITGKHVSDVTERDVTVVPIAVEQAVSNVPSVMVLE